MSCLYRRLCCAITVLQHVGSMGADTPAILTQRCVDGRWATHFRPLLKDKSRMLDLCTELVDITVHTKSVVS